MWRRVAVVRTGCGSRTSGAAVEAAVSVMRRPGYLVALVLLVVNDRWLKAAPPGVVTGKLSDAAWLLVAAPLAGLLLAPVARWLEPRGWAATAAAVPAAVLVALEASRASADVVEAAVSWLWPSATTVDRTDLLVLPVALLAWRWLRAAISSAGDGSEWRPLSPSRASPRSGREAALAGRGGTWLLVGLAVTATTATSCVGTRGVVAVGAVDDRLVAVVDGGSVRTWESRDGGRTWAEADDEDIPEIESVSEGPTPTATATPDPEPEVIQADPCPTAGACYEAGVLDLRQGEDVVWSLPASRADVMRRSWERSGGCGEGGLAVGTPAVLESGAVVVPRGVDGVLVGDVAEGFDRVAVGPHVPVATRQLDPSLLGPELLQATGVGVLVVLLTGLYGLSTARRGGWGRCVGGVAVMAGGVVVALACTAFALVLSPQADGISVMSALILLPLFWLAAAAGSAVGGVDGRVTRMSLLAGAGTALAVVLPFLAWLPGLVPYGVATAMAVVLGVVVAVTGPVRVHRWKTANPPVPDPVELPLDPPAV